MSTRKQPRQPSGGAKLKAAGKRPVLLGLTAEQHATVKAAAEMDGRPVTQFLLHYGLQAARRLLGSSEALRGE